jgi:hypothetical protein
MQLLMSFAIEVKCELPTAYSAYIWTIVRLLMSTMYLVSKVEHRWADNWFSLVVRKAPKVLIAIITRVGRQSIFNFHLVKSRRPN